MKYNLLLLQVMFIHGRFLTIAAIAIDRYIKITKLSGYLTYIAKKAYLWMLITIWITMLIFQFVISSISSATSAAEENARNLLENSMELPTLNATIDESFFNETTEISFRDEDTMEIPQTFNLLCFSRIHEKTALIHHLAHAGPGLLAVVKVILCYGNIMIYFFKTHRDLSKLSGGESQSIPSIASKVKNLRFYILTTGLVFVSIVISAIVYIPASLSYDDATIIGVLFFNLGTSVDPWLNFIFLPKYRFALRAILQCKLPKTYEKFVAKLKVLKQRNSHAKC